MSRPVLRSSILFMLGLLASAVLTGCDREDVKVYRVAKEQSAPSASSQDSTQAGQMPSGHPDVSGGAPPQLTWKTPEGWSEVLPGEMRVASFNVKIADGRQADVSVIPLPGGAGGDVANVNRWRGQVGLPPLSPDDLKKLEQAVKVAGQPAKLYEQAGKNPSSGDDTRILAVIQHREGTAWFFKMTGDDRLVAEQKPVFIEFLKSLDFGAQRMATAPPSRPPIENTGLPAGHPDISGTSVAAGEVTSKEGRPDWAVPAAWKEVSGGQFLVAKFVISGEGNTQAAVNISSSAGDGGGMTANVNRWRKQLGLGELSDDEITKSVKTVEGASDGISIVEMSGTDARSHQPARLVGAIVPHSGQTWFYKLMGDSKVVESQKEAFTKFVQSVKY